MEFTSLFVTYGSESSFPGVVTGLCILISRDHTISLGSILTKKSDCLGVSYLIKITESEVISLLYNVEDEFNTDGSILTIGGRTVNNRNQLIV